MVNTKRLRRPLIGLLALVGAAGLLVGCTDDIDWAGPPGTDSRRVIGPITDASRVHLVGFTDCEGDLQRLEKARRDRREERRREMERADVGIAGSYSTSAGRMADGGDSLTAMDSSTGEAVPSTAGEVVAGTNLVEADVDESDIIKTDGRRIVTLRNGVLRVTLLDDDPGIDGSLRLENTGPDVSMYLVDDTVTVISGVIGGGYRRGGDSWEGSASGGASIGVRTLISQIDISDPTRPTELDSVEVEGTTRSSRAVGGRIHVVISSDSVGVLPQVSYDGSPVEELGGCGDVRYETMPIDADPDPSRSRSSDDAVVGAVETSEPVTTPAPSEPWTSRAMTGPTISVLSFTDLSDGIDPVIIAGTAGTVYASTGSLYVASPLWDIGADGTAVHRLALTDDGPVDHVGSGVVPGQLLNEFSLSEYDGILRLVTTVQPTAPSRTDGPEPAADVQWIGRQSTRVSNLDITDMTVVGHLDGLAPGEDVRAVRFVAAMGYVVTFQQTDPLFAIDLSDPTEPVVLGELEIPGFSEYLHPIGDGRLVGVGRSIDPVSLRDEGLKISLFDVSDPYAPTELDVMVMADSRSIVTDDHHGFTWDPIRGQMILPVEGRCTVTERYAPAPEIVDDGSPGRRRVSNVCGGALVLSTDGGRLSEKAWIGHGPSGVVSTTPDRSVIVAENIWTFSAAGLGSSPVWDPAAVRLIPFV